MQILDHPEFGSTTTFSDGRFALAVNAGGSLTVEVEGSDFLPVQRIETIEWGAWHTVGEVQVTPLDTRSGKVTQSSDEVQVVTSTPQTDDAGTRRTTLLFDPGTTATMTLPNGDVEPLLGDMTIRATEFTVGDDFRDAMPAQLPSSSGYTWAAEFSVDQALAAGASEVTFNKPVTTYVDNFLGLFPGARIPAGYLDRETGRWIAAQNGFVMDVIGIQDGKAVLDVDDDPEADPEKYADLGIDDAERAELARLYPQAAEDAWVSLWRVQVDHFTPWDYNLPMGPPDGASPPPGPNGSDRGSESDKRPCAAKGSTILCESQVLQEGVDLTGTPLSLTYSSDRVPGRKTARELKIPIRDGSETGPLGGIRVGVAIAGRTFTDEFDPDAHPGSTYTFVWDGLDADGRPLEGDVTATITVSYGYEFVYRSAENFQRSFARFGDDVSFTRPVNRTSCLIGAARQAAADAVCNRLKRGTPAYRASLDWVSRTYARTIGSYDARTEDNGGWRFDQVHQLDPARKVVTLGDGRIFNAGGLLSAEVSTAAGTGTQAGSADVGTGPETAIGTVRGLGAAPDGTVYFADSSNGVVSRISQDGQLQVVAGGGGPNRGDGLEAISARFVAPWDVVVAPDGSIYVADAGDDRVRKVGPDGKVSTVAGGGDPADGLGDGLTGPAARLSNPRGIALAASGELYIADTGHDRIRVLYPDGRIDTIAGGGSPTDGVGDGGAGTRAAFELPVDVTVDDRDIFVADQQANRVRAIRSTDGVIRTVAGNGDSGSVKDGGAATDATLGGPTGVSVMGDGTLLIADRTHNRIRSVSTTGAIDTVFGTGRSPQWSEENGDGGLPREATLDTPYAVVALPSGGIAVTDSGHFRVRVAGPAVSGTLPGTEFVVPDPDDDLVYEFDATGRHLATRDAITGGVALTFQYDDRGRLTSVKDARGSTSAVVRVGGKLQKVVAPTGETTSFALDGAGWVGKVTDNANGEHTYTYDAGGLMATSKDPAGGVHRFGYDAMGRLTRDENADGGVITVSRSTPKDGVEITTTTTSTGRIRTVKSEVVRANQPGMVSPLEAQVGGVRRTTTEPDGSTSISFVGDDDSRWTRDPQGAETTVRTRPDPRWGALRRLPVQTVQTRPGGGSMTTTTDHEFQLARTGDPLSMTTYTVRTSNDFGTATRVVDVAGGQVTQTDVDGVRTVADFNEFGETTRVQRGDLAATTARYDNLGRVVESSLGAGPSKRTTEWTYRGSFVASEKNPAGQVTAVTTDGLGRVLSTTAPGRGTTQTGYDGVGRVTSITPPGQSAHRIGVSAGGRLLSYDAPGTSGVDRAYTYNADGLATGVRNGDGSTTTFGLDGVGRTTSRTHADGTNRRFGFTDQRLTSVNDSAGVDVSWSFDAAGAVTGTTWSGAVDGTVSYDYTGLGQLTSMKVAGGSPTSYSYNSSGLLTGVGGMSLTIDGDTGWYSSDSIGGLKGASRYDEFGAFSGIDYERSGQTLFASQVTGRDAVGRITARTETVGDDDVAYAYTYDAAGRLATVAKNGTVVESYTYDANGNRVSATAPGLAGGASTYNGRDQLTSAPGGVSFSYDADGQLSARSGSGGAAYSWDRFGFLTKVRLAGGREVSYRQDGTNQRVGRSVDGTKTDGFLYDIGGRVVGWLDGGGAVKARFAFATGTAPALMTKSGTTYRLLTDHVGSVRAVVNTSTGEVVQRIDYDAYGRVLSDSNPGFQPFGYAGGLTDPDTGLVRFGARDYDPQTGRWLSLDPLGFDGGDTNLYAYVASDPVNLVDPSGMLFGGFTPWSPAKMLWDAGSSAVKSVGGAIGGAVGAVAGAVTSPCFLSVVKTGLDVVSMVPGLNIAATAVSLAIKTGECLAGRPCSKADLLSTAVGLVPGGRVAQAAGRVARGATAARTYRMLKRTSPNMLGRAKLAYASGAESRDRVESAVTSVYVVNDGLGTLRTATGLVSDFSGYGEDLASYY